MKKAFDTVFIIFSRNDKSCISPPYIQQSDTLKVVDERDSIDAIEMPIYEFKEMNIAGDSAYIHLEFDISGTIAYGSLKQINEEWILDSTFVVGIR